MLYLRDYETLITDYIANSGQEPSGWDVEMAARELRDKYPDIASADEVDADDLTAALERHEA